MSAGRVKGMVEWVSIDVTLSDVPSADLALIKMDAGTKAWALVGTTIDGMVLCCGIQRK
jgi:hypothetical protein